jgi:hypothetical protein
MDLFGIGGFCKHREVGEVRSDRRREGREVEAMEEMN